MPIYPPWFQSSFRDRSYTIEIVQEARWGGIQSFTQTPDIVYIQSVKFPTPISHASTEFLLSLYVTQNFSLEEIASEFKVSRCAVTREFRSRGIKIRKKDENIKRRRGLKYGMKVRVREAVNFKKEMEVVEKIKDLRAKGLVIIKWQIF